MPLKLAATGTEPAYRQYDNDMLNPDTFRWHERVRHDPSIEHIRAVDEIRRLGLERYAAELDAQGYTVVPPEVVAPTGFMQDVLEACLAVVERTQGVTIDRAAGLDAWNLDPAQLSQINASSFGMKVPCLVREGRIFEQLLMNGVNLALISYLVGERALLYTYTLLLKGAQSPPIDLHADTFFMPPPWPSYPVLGQSMVVLNDYSKADGSTGFVPGSHRAQRLPQPGEGEDRIVHVEAQAGSLVVFSGHTWHCAAPRTNAGFRAAIALHFCRHWVQTQNEFRGVVGPEVLDRNPPRFRQLLHEAPTFGDPASRPAPARADVR